MWAVDSFVCDVLRILQYTNVTVLAFDLVSFLCYNFGMPRTEAVESS
jgi:hypothetical protein